jgi:hypothetical protein
MAENSKFEQLWIEEAQRRYDAYLKGDLKSHAGDDVMARARARLMKESTKQPRSGEMFIETDEQTNS